MYTLHAKDFTTLLLVATLVQGCGSNSILSVQHCAMIEQGHSQAAPPSPPKVPLDGTVPPVPGAQSTPSMYPTPSVLSTLGQENPSCTKSNKTEQVAPTRRCATEDKCISTAYWYEEYEISRVLEAELAVRSREVSEDKKCYTHLNGTKIFLLGPLDNISPYGLAQALQAHACQPGIVLIPFNLGRSHWVGLRLEYSPDNKLVAAQYYDSLQQSVPPYLNAILQRHPTHGEHIVQTFSPIGEEHCLVQPNGSDCGPCTIENLLAADTFLDYQTESNPTQRRLRHLETLERNDYGGFYAAFYERQQSNRSSFRREEISSTSDWCTMSCQEHNALQVLAAHIRKLPALTKRIQAIHFEQEEPGQVLTAIREALIDAQRSVIPQLVEELFTISATIFYLEGGALDDAPLQMDFHQLQDLQKLLLPARPTRTPAPAPSTTTIQTASAEPLFDPQALQDLGECLAAQGDQP